MPISYDSNLRVFRLDTPRTTYLMALVGRENFLGHVYYGPKIPNNDMGYLLRLEERPFTPDQNPGEQASFYDAFPFEYPVWGEGTSGSPACGCGTPMAAGTVSCFMKAIASFPASRG